MMDDALRTLVLGEAAMAGLTGAARYRNEPDAAMWDPLTWESTPTGVPPTVSVYPCSMWTWSLNWGEITPRIVVGTCPMTPADLDRIGAEADVSALLSLQHNDCLAYWGIDSGQMCTHGAKLGLRMARSPMRDFDIDHQRQRLPNAVAALANLQAQGHRTYVHCTAGLGRAPLTVLSYLICFDGRSPQEAIRLIHNGRPGAVPAWDAYHGCREDLVGRHRPRIQQHAYELSQGRAGGQGDAEADWLQAEIAVIRSVLADIAHKQERLSDKE